MGILDQFSLKGKKIVITGGTGVLGKSFVHALAEAGAEICILGRSEDKIKEAVQTAENLGTKAIGLVADVMNEDSVQAAKENLLKQWDSIDGLINAVGGNIPGATIGEQQSIFDNKIQDTIKAIELNLYGTIIPTLIFGEIIADKGKGSIINISSLAASRPLTRVLGYTVAKHGIDGFTKWMATELAIRYGDKVRVNAIAPGVFLTEQNRNLLTNPDGSYAERAQKFINGTPYGRLGDPSELEGTLVYLLSDASAFVTGETIFVDGGFNAWCGV